MVRWSKCCPRGKCLTSKLQMKSEKSTLKFAVMPATWQSELNLSYHLWNDRYHQTCYFYNYIHSCKFILLGVWFQQNNICITHLLWDASILPLKQLFMSFDHYIMISCNIMCNLLINFVVAFIWMVTRLGFDWFLFLEIMTS